MRPKAIIAALALASGLAQAQNPIIHDQFTADPTARVFDGRVYLYPSHDIPPVEKLKGWFCMPDYHVFSSADLSRWTDHGVILRQEDVPWGDPEAYSMWAPDCVERGGKYYFYFPDAPAGKRGFGVGVAVADSPAGPFTPMEHAIEGLMGIDPCVLVDGDKSYIYWAGGGIRGAELDSTMAALATAPAAMEGLPEGFKEGPFAFKRAGKYYLTFPWVRKEKGTETLAYAMSDNPLGPWEFKGLIMEEHPNGCWTNHHSIVEIDGQWCLFYHCNDYSPDFDKNRSARIDYLEFEPDGTIALVRPTNRGVGVADPYTRIEIDRGVSEKGKVEYLDKSNPFAGWYISLKKGQSVDYPRVDFGDVRPEYYLMRVRAKQGARVQVNGHIFNLPKMEDWTTVRVGWSGRQADNIEIQCVAGQVDIDWMQFFNDAADQAGVGEPYYSSPQGYFSLPDRNGFIRRWHVLEPISMGIRTNVIFTDSYLREVFGHDHFAGQRTTIPYDGMTVEVGDSVQLAWHSIESTGSNVQLFRFAGQTGRPVYGVLFWAVTVIDVIEPLVDVRLAAGSNSASMWWVDGEEALILSGDRRMVMDDGMSPRLTLTQGKHTIRVAVINGPGMSNFCARFVDERGNPVNHYLICEQ